MTSTSTAGSSSLRGHRVSALIIKSPSAQALLASHVSSACLPRQPQRLWWSCPPHTQTRLLWSTPSLRPDSVWPCRLCVCARACGANRVRACVAVDVPSPTAGATTASQRLREFAPVCGCKQMPSSQPSLTLFPPNPASRRVNRRHDDATVRHREPLLHSAPY